MKIFSVVLSSITIVLSVVISGRVNMDGVELHWHVRGSSPAILF